MERSLRESDERSALLGRSFLGILVAQLFGSFNDNAFRLLIVAALKAQNHGNPSADGAIVAGTGAMLVLPFMLFSPNAGRLSDRFSKRTIIVWSKVAELVLMCLGLAAMSTGSAEALFVLLFLMGTQSAFFSPAKYGLLPEILPSEKLSKGNGVFELVNFVAIVLGMAYVGAFVFLIGRDPAELGPTEFAPASLLLILFAVAGTTAALGIGRVSAAAPDLSAWCNPMTALAENFRVLKGSRALGMTVAGVAFFWFVGPIVQQNILVYDHVWPSSPNAIYGMVVVLALGIGMGSLLAGVLSGGKVELGLVPLGAIGICIFSLALSLSSGSIPWSFLWLALAAASSGFYFVPLHTLLQHDSPADKKGAVLATTNFVAFSAMLAASGTFFVWNTPLEMGGPQIFAVVGLLTLAVACYLCWLLPAFLVRFLLWLATHSLYRIRVARRSNVPEEGPALLVSNHVSWVDGLLIQAVLPRPVRFVVASEYARLPLLSRLGRWFDAIPVSPREGPRAILGAVRTAREALAAGEVVCVFAEGQITRTGGLMPFRRGFQRITKGLDVPIVPVYLDRLWGSIFSFHRGRFFWKVPRQVPYPVTVAFGTPLPTDSAAWQVRQAVQETGAESVELRKATQMPLHRQFVHMAARHPFRPCMADSTGVDLRYGAALIRTMVLARILGRQLGSERMVGVLLPATVGGALTNIALSLLGKVPVNLNFTTSPASIESSIRQCGIRQVITSKLFLKKLKLHPPGEHVYLEDLRKQAALADKLVSWVAFWLLPRWLLEHGVLGLGSHGIDDLATVIFSSGSTGEPKGVMLSQHNLVSNAEAVVQTANPRPTDVLLATLPFFHSFGFTVTLWVPLLVGAKTVYHPSPLEAKEIGKLCRTHRATLFLTTPTFLRTYLRRCGPDDFRTVRLLLCGAEKMPTETAKAFHERFGVQPLEGYGCTELSPVVAANVHDYEQDGLRQVGNKLGTVGHPLPGMAVRIVDPDTRRPLPPGEDGLLEVKGPNVMIGYLGKPELTEEAIHDGWYETGDIARIDSDGFITITDRLSRFSKVGGEMVPHGAVEEKLHGILGSEDRQVAVVGLPDDRKGERLVVIHTPLQMDHETLWQQLSDSGLPNLWVPDRDAFYEVPELPLLGTGKLNLRELREMAAELASGASKAQ